MKRFLIDKNYSVFLKNAGVSVEEVLKKAMIPEDLFSRETPTLTAEEYYRFMEAIDFFSADKELPVKLATAENIESFSPPIFAAYCSRNAEICIKRLAAYKPLIGALRYNVTSDENSVAVEIGSEGDTGDLPEILVGIEFTFVTNLIRKATKENIVPKSVTAKKSFNNPEFARFLQTEIVGGDRNEIVFSRKDAEIPFITANESMWNFFEPELQKRLSMTEIDDTFSARVRSALMELLPSGECTIDDVAKKLFTSKRTIQRKLQEEDTNFQKQLNHTRELLAKHYIKNTQMTTEDIAYLLGYQDTSSFLRAFSIWTGKTVSEFRENI